jgi:hypothetical protein
VRRSNLKEVSNATPEQLTWNQIDTLARSLAVDLMDSENTEIVHTLLLFMQEIGLHSHEQSHIETALPKNPLLPKKCLTLPKKREAARPCLPDETRDLAPRPFTGAAAQSFPNETCQH